MANGSYYYASYVLKHVGALSFGSKTGAAQNPASRCGQNKAATLPQSDGIICLQPEPKDADTFCVPSIVVTNGCFYHPSLVVRCARPGRNQESTPPRCGQNKAATQFPLV